MSEITTVPLGRLRIRGDDLVFDPGDAAIDVLANGRVEIGLEYDYREMSLDRETVHIELDVEVDGKPAGRAERTIKDNPTVDDSRRGFLSLATRLARGGEVPVSYLVRAKYAIGPWRGEDDDHVTLVRSGTLKLRAK